jgi:membrane protease YdiL (CAAX protease family)
MRWPRSWASAPSIENAQHVSGLILMPLVEEPGWRGFALPRLHARHGPLAASLLLGVVWAGWHTTMWILQGLTPLTFLIATITVVAGSVVFSWLYDRTGGSLLFAVLAHVGSHLDNPFRAGAVAPMAVYASALVVTATVLGAALARRAHSARRP